MLFKQHFEMGLLLAGMHQLESIGHACISARCKIKELDITSLQ
jgi:hypothetical protein